MIENIFFEKNLSKFSLYLSLLQIKKMNSWKPSSLRETVEFGHYVNNELCDENVSAASNMASKTDDENMEVDDEDREFLILKRSSNSTSLFFFW